MTPFSFRARSLPLLTPAGLAVLLLVGCGEASAPASETASEAPMPEDPAYVQEVADWREQRDAGLRNPEGWLTLAGLYWLDEGESRFGSGESNEVVFPEGKAPAQIGTLRRDGDSLTVRASAEAGLTHQGEPVTEMVMATDASGSPTVLELGSLSFFAIQRGERLGIRLRDRDSATLAGFEGMEHYPARAAWRIQARLNTDVEQETIQVPNVLGDLTASPTPGRLEFEVGGETHHLWPMGEAGSDLFIVFGDATNGDETYGGGRFLSAAAPDEDGTVILDFNKAYNPPCVFTPFATCPLPPAINKLPARIEAGELAFAKAAH